MSTKWKSTIPGMSHKACMTVLVGHDYCDKNFYEISQALGLRSNGKLYFTPEQCAVAWEQIIETSNPIFDEYHSYMTQEVKGQEAKILAEGLRRTEFANQVIEIEQSRLQSRVKLVEIRKMDRKERLERARIWRSIRPQATDDEVAEAVNFNALDER